MNRKRNLAITAATSLVCTASLVSGTAQAASSKMLDQMMDTCIQQFVASNFADYQGKITVQKPSSTYHGPALMAGGGSYEFTVAAVGRPGSAQLATATCQMARDGSVISIKSSSKTALKVKAQPVVVAKN